MKYPYRLDDGICNTWKCKCRDHMANDVPDIIVAFPISLWVRCERVAMPPTITVVTMAILMTIKLFIWLKAFASLVV